MEFRVDRGSVAAVQRGLEQADETMRREGRQELLTLGELVEHDAERLARGSVVGAGRHVVDWAAMRTGSYPSVVYVVPQARGTKIPARKRRNFAPRMLTRAMRPALAGRRQEIYDRFQRLSQAVCARFNG